MEEREYLELREWSPSLADLWEHIPATISKSFILRQDVEITSIDAVDEFFALGTTAGIFFWYNRSTKQLNKFNCPSPSSSLTCIKIVSSVEYLVAVGDASGNVFIFQIPKDIPQDLQQSLSGVSITPLLTRPKQFCVRDLHQGVVKCLEWSKNGMKLFSGDKSGNIVLTELDLIKNESRSSVILNEAYEIVQIRFQQPRWLLISSIFRTVICEKTDTNHWRLRQVGMKDRKLLSICGGTFLNDEQKPPTIICSRPGGRFWIADVEGQVQRTLVYKDIFEARRPEVPLMNPSRKFMKITNEFQRLHSYMDDYCVTSNADAVFVLNLKKNRVEATVKYLRGVLDVSVNKQEIFIVEGPRSIVRIATSVDPYGEVRSSLYNPLVTSLYDPPLNDKSVSLDSSPESDCDLAGASECKELTPIEHLDIEKLLSEAWPRDKKLNGDSHEEHLEGDDMESKRRPPLFEQINEETFDENILFRSRRLKVVEATSPGCPTESKGIVEIAQLARADTEEDQEEVIDDEETSERTEGAGVVPRIPVEQEVTMTTIPDMKIKVTASDPVIEESAGSDGEDTEESFLSEEIQSYSSRFISDDNMQELVNGMTSSWKGAIPELGKDFVFEINPMSLIRDVPGSIEDLNQAYYSEAEDDSASEEEDEGDALEGWEYVTHEDCEEDVWTVENSEWVIVNYSDNVDE